MRTRLPIAVFVAAASAALLAQTTTQDKEQQQPRPTFRTEANYVRVDMYAMRDDQPVEDLKAEEIEILEDGTPQKMATFEHVKVRPAGPQETRVEPNTVAQSRQAAADPRARVFVIFLDTHHVQIEGSHAMRRPVVQFLDRVIGQDDLVAVMTPEMSAADITFGRKTTIISKMMGDDWAWGRRERLVNEDPKEIGYEVCYPEDAPAANGVPQTQGVAHEMIERRREKLTFDALDDLIVHLGGIREERKAVLTVSEGWRLYGFNRALSAPIKVPGSQGGSQVPDGLDPIFVGKGGKLRTGRDPRSTLGDSASRAECDADRVALAEWDGRIRFRDLFEKANRGNVSFYTVHPRGLVAFDYPIGPRKPPPIVAGPGDRRGNHDTPTTDRESLTARHNSLQELAENTDAIAIVNTNAIEQAMQRIVSDLTSVLSPRLLLVEPETRRQVQGDHGAREAARGPGPGAARLSGDDRGAAYGRRGRGEIDIGLFCLEGIRERGGGQPAQPAAHSRLGVECDDVRRHARGRDLDRRRGRLPHPQGAGVERWSDRRGRGRQRQWSGRRVEDDRAPGGARILHRACA